jgi:diphthamide biosynthesis protein 3
MRHFIIQYFTGFTADHHHGRAPPKGHCGFILLDMGGYYDEIEIEDMVWDADKSVYHYPCPCGDRFEISRQQLADYEDIATCPSCSLIIRVIYDPVRFLCRYVSLPFGPTAPAA